MDEKDNENPIKEKQTNIDKFKIYFKNLDCFSEIVEIDYNTLKAKYPDLSELLIEKPLELIMAAKKAIRDIYGHISSEEDSEHPEHDIIIKNVPVSHSINKIRSIDIGKLIAINARIIEASDIRPRMSSGTFECRSCMLLHKIPQRTNLISEPALCHECGGRNFRLLQEESEFIDNQNFILEGIHAGETRQFKAIIEGSLVEYNKYKQGDEVYLAAIPTVLKVKQENEIFLMINNMEVTQHNDPIVHPENDETLPKSNIYFVYDGESVKIGKADDPQKRVSGLQTGSSKSLKLLYTMKGDERLESFLHELFEPYRKVGEWFSVDGLLKEFLRRGYIIGTHETVKHYADFYNESEENNSDENEGRIPVSDRDKFRIIINLIKELEEEYGGRVPKQILFDDLKKRFNFDEKKVDTVIRLFKRTGKVYEPKQGFYKVA